MLSSTTGCCIGDTQKMPDDSRSGSRLVWRPRMDTGEEITKVSILHNHDDGVLLRTFIDKTCSPLRRRRLCRRRRGGWRRRNLKNKKRKEWSWKHKGNFVWGMEGKPMSNWEAEFSTNEEQMSKQVGKKSFFPPPRLANGKWMAQIRWCTIQDIHWFVDLELFFQEFLFE